MGGSATMIHGNIDPRRLEHPRGYFARLFGRGVTEIPMGNDRALIDLPCRDLKDVADGFPAWLRDTLADAWVSSKAILDYLDTAAPNIHLRGDREGATTSWYVQVGFSGCAGLAQTSADVASHWAQKWFDDERERIDALLRPRGFFAERAEAINESSLFLPIGAGGYAGYSVEGWMAGSQRSHYEFDAAIEENDEGAAQRLRQVLDTQLVALMADGQCRCQLCMPDFDRSLLAALPDLA
jgi:hypothetical protein